MLHTLAKFCKSFLLVTESLINVNKIWRPFDYSGYLQGIALIIITYGAFRSTLNKRDSSMSLFLLANVF